MLPRVKPAGSRRWLELEVEVEPEGVRDKAGLRLRHMIIEPSRLLGH